MSNRCYDCLAAIRWDEFLCVRCQEVYRAEKLRKEAQG